jgi:hypothetical protein
MNPVSRDGPRTPTTHRKAIFITMCVTLLLLLAYTYPSFKNNNTNWTTSWGASLQLRQRQEMSTFQQGQRVSNVALKDTTLRQRVRLSMGGTRLRVCISNVFGSQTLVVGAAHVHIAGQVRPLSFPGGEQSVQIVPGWWARSEEIDVVVEPLSEILIDLYFPLDVTWRSHSTVHAFTTQMGLIGEGNQSGSTKFMSLTDTVYKTNSKITETSRASSWFYLWRVDLYAPNTKAIVCLGDSITDGHGTELDTFNRYLTSYPKVLYLLIVWL